MIPLLDRAAGRAFDQEATERFRVPGAVLMENAGRGAAELIRDRLPGQLGRSVVVGGTGQNGGDAWVVARHLVAAGVPPAGVFLVGDPAKVRGDAAPNLAALRALGHEPVVIAPDGDHRPLRDALAGASLVVDGLFGTGLDREVTGGRVAVLEAIGAAPAPCVALDLPSGVDVETGALLGPAPQAVLTATFGGFKPGLVQHPGAERAGEVVLVGLGVPPPAERSPAGVRPTDGPYLFEPEDAAQSLRPRPADAHKGTAGHLLVVAGAPGRTGAALLAGLGALRSGAGLVTIASRGAAREAVDGKVIEIMTAEIPEAGPLDDAVAQLIALSESRRAAVVGPGLGTDARGLALARRLAVELAVPTVLDADALTAFADDPEALVAAAGPRLLTPHPGEAARLLGGDVRAVQRDRLASARRLATLTGAAVVLKGAGTVVADPEGVCLVCRRGTPALGVGGTGDVLAGVLGAGLLEDQVGEALAVAGARGALVHALAGERAAVGDRGLFAREVADAIPEVLAGLLASR